MRVVCSILALWPQFLEWRGAQLNGKLMTFSFNTMMHHPTDNFDYTSAIVRRPRAATISFSPFAPIEPEFVAAEESRLGTLAWLATVVDTDVEAANFLTELSHKVIKRVLS